MKTSAWMKNKVKHVNKERMNLFIEKIAKENHVSLLKVKLDLYWNVLTRGVGYTDYFRGDYINRSKEEKKTFVTARSFHNILAYLNDPNYEVVLHDKLLFNEVFKEFLNREFLNLRVNTYAEFEHFCQIHETFFAKDPVGEGGHGVQKITMQEISSMKELYNTLLKQKQYLVEEAIVQSDEVNEINPSVVNSFRIVTLYKDGKVTILNNAFRINQGKDEVIGCTNDLYFSLNEEGKIDSNVIDDYGTIYKTHPLTHKAFSEVKIKGVKEAFQMCQQAALKLPQVRYIGWDIAFTQKGPVIVEGNEYPGYGIIQYYLLKNKKTGHLKEISDVLKEEMSKIKL